MLVCIPQAFYMIVAELQKGAVGYREKKETYTCTKARNAQPASQPAQYSPTSITEALAPFQSSVIQAGVNAHM